MENNQDMEIAKEDRPFQKRYALSLLLKDINDGAERMSAGKSFQILGASKLNLALKCLVDLWMEGIY